MPNEQDLRAEIEALRQEVAALRNARVTSSPEIEAELADLEAAALPAWRNVEQQLRVLGDEIGAFSRDTEQALTAHPVAGAAAALLFGFVIGRLWPRS